MSAQGVRSAKARHGNGVCGSASRGSTSVAASYPRKMTQPPAKGSAADDCAASCSTRSRRHHISSASRKPGAAGVTPCAQVLPSRSDHSAARGSAENARTTERPMRHTVEERRELRRIRSRKEAQYRGGYANAAAVPVHAVQPKRRKTKVPLVPPKPKELETATSIFIARASLGTKSRSQCGSGVR